VTYDQYVEDVLAHLLNTECYKRLTEEEARTFANRLEEEILQWLSKYKHKLGKHAANYILNHMEANVESPFGQFYILYKIHKGKKNGRWPTRPVCSDVTSLPHGLGKWVNEQLTPIQAAQISYFKDTFALKTLLDGLVLPPNALLFTSDATSMYTNIKTDPALVEISNYLRANSQRFKHCNTEALIEALPLVFKNNFFRFSDTFWEQTSGTGMGTPPAPPWATVFFGLHEEVLIPRWSEQVPFYKRFIDDVIGAWVPHPDEDENNKLWAEF
jgi:hypothetical protein